MNPKYSFALSFLTLACFVGLLISTPSCKKDKSGPTPIKSDTIYFVIEGVEVSNGMVTSLGYNAVKLQGDFKKLQASSFKIIDYGYVISSSMNSPTIGNNEGTSSEGERTGVGIFDSELTGLIENTTYYARIYLKRQIIATGKIEYGYHPHAISFKTKPGSSPNLNNLETKNITKKSFQVNAIIQDENLLAISQYGHIWSKTNPNLNLSSYDNKTSFGSLQSVFTHQFSSDIDNLTANTTYYVRAYATNRFGTGYSPVINVHTTQASPTVSADFNFTPNSNIELGTVVKFNNFSSTNATNFYWSFGDETFSQEKNPQKIYTKAGQFEVMLIASDAARLSQDTIIKNLHVIDVNFAFYPLDNIVADVTTVVFSSPYDGSSSRWNFGEGEQTSNQQALNYIFTKEGEKQVSLTKVGLNGQVSKTKIIKVWATPPCHNRELSSNHSSDKILYINNNGLLKTGAIKVNHNYNGCAYIYLYHPTDWLSGNYQPFNNQYFEVCTGTSSNFGLGTANNLLFIGMDWGIKIKFTNGVESCIRTLRDVATYSNNQFTVLSSKIFEGQ